MKKGRIFGLFGLLFTLTACGSINVDFDNNDPIGEFETTGDLSNFNLLSPSENNIVQGTPTFSWEASNNAISYTLEVCSEENFVHVSSEVTYIKETNISVTSFNLSADLKAKNTTYYWKVTAVNNFNASGKRELLCNKVFSFYLESANVEEINVGVGEPADWSLHELGSYADIDVDHSNFFGGDDPDSLCITFETENTKRGNVTSDGWIVVSRALEMDFYGTDCLLFNFYYSGNDSNIFIRLVDQDGEYWHCQIKVSMNAKQTVLIPFADFELRTKDTTVQNEIFNYEHIQMMEIVFERTFGDGACVIGNVRAVTYKNYEDLFIRKLDFSKYSEEDYINESYNFTKTVTNDGRSLTLSYDNVANENNTIGMGSAGYGFTKLVLNKYFFGGNAIKFKARYTGTGDAKSQAVIRIYEEDTDRWFYEQPFTTLPKDADEGAEFIVPFNAFTKSEIRADGNRQFFYILQLQLGVRAVYGAGSVTFEDIEIVSVPSVENNKTTITSNGLIDDFDSYVYRGELYQYYETSVDNKDESMSLNTSEKFVSSDNTYCGEFTYKSDMGPASYDRYLNVEYEGGNALKIWIKDACNVMTDLGDRFKNITKDTVNTEFIIQFALKDGRWYRYQILHTNRLWTEYIIRFEDFTLYQGEIDPEHPTWSSEDIVNFAFGLQYFYYDDEGKSYPCYTQNNPVYVDNIYLVQANKSSETILETEITPSQKDPKVTYVDDFEYSDNEALYRTWLGVNALEYEALRLSNDVSRLGGAHSMEIDYKGGNASPAYAMYPKFSSSVTGKALQIDIKGDNQVTLYINIYFGSGKQVRATLTQVSASWTRYTLGFDKSIFADPNGSTSVLSSSNVPTITKITFGAVCWSGSFYGIGHVYIDNIVLSSNLTYTSKTQTVID